jgi:hypothetical protein
VYPVGQPEPQVVGDGGDGAGGVGADPSVHAHVTDDFAAQIKYFSSNSVPVGQFMTALGLSYVQ